MSNDLTSARVRSTNDAADASLDLAGGDDEMMIRGWNRTVDAAARLVGGFGWTGFSRDELGRDLRLAADAVLAEERRLYDADIDPAEWNGGRLARLAWALSEAAGNGLPPSAFETD